MMDKAQKWINARIQERTTPMVFLILAGIGLNFKPNSKYCGVWSNCPRCMDYLERIIYNR